MNKISRKLRYALEDVREYWLVRFARLAGSALFWSTAFVTAIVLLPFSERRRKGYAARVSTAVGKLMWEFKDVAALREWLPPMRNLVHAEVRRPDGSLKWADYGFNLRTDVGRDWQCERLGDATPFASAVSVADYISVHSASGYTPAAGDTQATWETNEELAVGFSRQQGTFAHTAGTGVYTIEHDSYTATGSVTIYGAALLNEGDSPSELPFCIKNFASSAAMENLDTLKVTWSITV